MEYCPWSNPAVVRYCAWSSPAPGGKGMSSITLTADVWSRLQTLANVRKTDIAGVLSEAIGLEETVVQAQEAGSRILIETHGRLQELVPTAR